MTSRKHSNKTKVFPSNFPHQAFQHSKYDKVASGHEPLETLELEVDEGCIMQGLRESESQQSGGGSRGRSRSRDQHD